MKRLMNISKYSSAFCLVTACAETLCWAFTGRGYTQTILSTEDVSPFLVNPVVIFYWLLAGMWSHDLATAVREFVLAPIPWFSSRAAVQGLRTGAVVQGIVLIFILLHVFSTVREHGMDTVFSAFMSLVGIPTWRSIRWACAPSAA